MESKKLKFVYQVKPNKKIECEKTIKERLEIMEAYTESSNIPKAIRKIRCLADIVAQTLYAYTEEIKYTEDPNLREFARMFRDFKDDAYVMIGCHLSTLEDATKCMYLGTHLEVVGSAITRPYITVKHFIDLLNVYQTNWRDAERSKH